MDPPTLGAIVAVATILVLFSGVSVALGLLIVATVFLMIFGRMRSLELLPEILFGKLDNFALLSIPMFIIMGASIASTRAGADLYKALARWLTRVPGGLVISNLRAFALFAAMCGSKPAICAAIGKMGIPEMRKRGYLDGVAAGCVAVGRHFGHSDPASGNDDRLRHRHRNLYWAPSSRGGDPGLVAGGLVYGVVTLFSVEIR